VLSYEAEVGSVTTSTGGSTLLGLPGSVRMITEYSCILYLFTLAVVVCNLIMPVLEHHILQTARAPRVQHTI
jgi:hypothetical protein